MKVRWSLDAKADLADIVDYISRDNPAAALRMDALLSEAAARLGVYPRLGRPGEMPDTREFFPHKHYRMVYSIVDDTVWIETVVHASRQWPPLEDDA